ncbi:MAG: MFS transporter [Ketobacteraceae bacterium]|nr:MFS transporter [Ketobacteraceae bacterium]
MTRKLTVDRFLIGLIAAMSLHAFDDMAIVTMLPAVTRQLGGESWFGASFFAYLLVSLISLVWAGHVTDRRGPRQPFIIGLLVFVAGLLVGAFSRSMPEFVLGRALQGFGGGAIQAVVFSAINLAYDESQRKRAISLLASAWVLPALLAPVIAGYVTEVWDWHWVFLGMIPFAVIVCVFTQHRLADLNRNSAIQPAPQNGITLTTLRVASGIGLFLAGLNWFADSWYVLLFLAIGAGLFIRPLLSLFPKGFLLARPGLSAALALKGLLVYACLGTEAFLPAYLTTVYEYSTFEAGSVVTSGAAAWILATWLYEVYGDRYPVRHLLLISTSLLLTGLLCVLVLLALLQWPGWVYAAWALVCFGMGMSYAIAVAQAMKFTSQGTEGATATGAGMVDAIGFSFAAGIGGAILNMTALYQWGMADSVPLIWLLNGAVACLAVGIAYRRF